MLTLIVRQSLKNGAAKTWKLRPGSATHTFGSSRLADVISINPQTKGIQGLFEFRDGQWWYVNLDASTSTQGDNSPALCIDKEQKIEIAGSTLEFTPVKRATDLYLRLDSAGKEARQAGKKVQLFIVEQNQKVLETKVINLNEKFRPLVAGKHVTIESVQTQDWHIQEVGNMQIKQRTISVEDAEKYGRLSADQIVDEESKKGAFFLLGAALLLISIGLFAPKNPALEVVAAPPRSAQKIIVKTEVKQKRQQQKAQAAPAQKVVIKDNPAPAGPKQEMPTSGSRVANMMKSLSGGRVSQLIGKVSAQAAKSGNVIISSGTKAGSGASGRAMAAVGNMERSGRDWGKDGAGNGGSISTVGRGGGGSASGMGGLASGGTGTAGVGLIEDEGEITGGLDREVIAQYIKSQLGQILYCYERQLSAKPDLFGKVAVKFTIGPAGAVEQQLIGDTTLKNATVEGCILNRVAAWKFPAPQGGTRVLVTYPFLFKSTN